MPALSFVTLDVFTTKRFGGNPLALVKIPKGQDVGSEIMQKIAAEFNLSESVFLYEDSQGADGVLEWKYRIFMTMQELPFAGHPTIGTACYALGTFAGGAKRCRLQCTAGPVEVEFDGTQAKCAIPHNVHLHQRSAFTEADLYELQPSLQGGDSHLAIGVVSPVKGMNFVCIQLRTLEDLAKIELGKKPLARLDEQWNEGFVGSYFYVITKQEARQVEVRTRMMEGNLEDPATGSAASALGALLSLQQRQKFISFKITQGVEMGRQSDIGVDVTLKDSLDAVEKVELSGSTVKVMEGSIDYD